MSRPQWRALVIEDDPLVRTLLRDLLEVLGYEVRTASDGAEGLRLFEPGRDHVVITDLMMPGATGWEVVETLRRDNPGLAVVMATGSVSNLDTSRLRELRVVLLSKPFTLPELRTAVDQAWALAALTPAESRPTAGQPLRGPEESQVAVTHDLSAGWLVELRKAAEMASALSEALARTMSRAEDAVRERDELWSRFMRLEQEHGHLRGAHEALTRSMDARETAYRQLQSEHEALRRAHEQTSEEHRILRSEKAQLISALEGILGRLRS